MSALPAGVSRRDADFQPSAPPARSSERKQGLTATQGDRSGAPLRVLVADDNLLIRTSLLNLFEKWGANCTICENGASTWEKLRRQRFDLLLIDLQMPKMDGHEVVARLRAQESNPNRRITVVAMAGNEDEAAHEQMLQSGATACMSKPLNPRHLFKLVAERTLVPEYLQTSLYTDVIDYAELQRLYQDDTAQLDMMLSMFLSTTPSALRRMEDAAAQGDWRGLERQVHRIRPNFALIGLGWISELAATFEESLSKQKNKLYDNVYTDFNRFRLAVKQSLSIVAKKRGSMQDVLK